MLLFCCFVHIFHHKIILYSFSHLWTFNCNRKQYNTIIRKCTTRQRKSWNYKWGDRTREKERREKKNICEFFKWIDGHRTNLSHWNNNTPSDNSGIAMGQQTRSPYVSNARAIALCSSAHYGGAFFHFGLSSMNDTSVVDHNFRLFEILSLALSLFLFQELQQIQTTAMFSISLDWTFKILMVTQPQPTSTLARSKTR